MHEGTVCREILMIAERAAHSNALTEITGITIAIGPHSCIQQDQLQMCFAFVREGTMAAQAQLHIITDNTITGKRQEFVRQIEGN